MSGINLVVLGCHAMMGRGRWAVKQIAWKKKTPWKYFLPPPSKVVRMVNWMRAIGVSELSVFITHTGLPTSTLCARGLQKGTTAIRKPLAQLVVRHWMISTASWGKDRSLQGFPRWITDGRRVGTHRLCPKNWAKHAGNSAHANSSLRRENKILMSSEDSIEEGEQGRFSGLRLAKSKTKTKVTDTDSIVGHLLTRATTVTGKKKRRETGQ